MPEASLTTVTVMVEPSRLALTSTPSIGPSASEVTDPVSAASGDWSAWVSPGNAASASTPAAKIPAGQPALRDL